MISKEELEKLTVAQIKEKLKSRKLSTAGTKPDLVTRLHENIVAEEKLLGTGLESAGPSEFDLDNVDVDEVLGLLDNDPAISSPDQPQQKKKTAVKQANKPPPVTATTVPAKPTELSTVEKPVQVEQPTVTKKEPKKPIAPPAGVASIKAAVKPVLNGKTEETTTTTTLTITDAGATDKKTSGLTSDEEQKMLNRAKRLGLPVGATAIAATTTTPATAGTEDALKKRAERFGAVSDESKKQARMQRFGQVTSSPAPTAVSAIAKDEALQKRAQRFGLPIGGVINTADDAAKKQARAQRFGPLSSDSVAVKRPAGASAEELALLEKRSKRFGVTSGN